METQDTLRSINKRLSDITLRSIDKKLSDMNKKLADIEITEAINNEINLLKGQIEGLRKEYKKHEAQLKDLNKELHEFNKWRFLVEDKIGEVE